MRRTSSRPCQRPLSAPQGPLATYDTWLRARKTVAQDLPTAAEIISQRLMDRKFARRSGEVNDRDPEPKREGDRP